MAMTTVENAMAFIKHNNVECFMTPEGVTAKAEAVMGDNVMRYLPDDEDNWFEELQAFPVVNGMVDIKPIKQWLGY